MNQEPAAHSGPPGAGCCGHVCFGTGDDHIGQGRMLPDFRTAVGNATAVSGLMWPAVASAAAGGAQPASRRPLVVKPILTYPLTTRRHQTSWRNWGGLETEADVAQEVARIQGEIAQLQGAVDFPVRFLPVAKVRGVAQLDAVADIAQADVILFYAAGDGAGHLMSEVNRMDKLGKEIVFFVRHQSGPLYYWYEGVSARYLRQHTDVEAVPNVRCEDVVVDRMDEVLWRLRALAGLYATRGSRLLTIGGPAAWGRPPQEVLDKTMRLWKFDVRSVSHAELGRLLAAACQDEAAIQRARRRAQDYLKLPATRLETDREPVERAFLVEEVLRGLMRHAECRAITLGDCASAVMPQARTTACLALSLLGDAGCPAFCESDFTALPAGILLANIAGRPAFWCHPAYPHDGLVTLAHCTAPRKMDGKTREPARILTHYESDFGAAPSVEMRVGQKVTLVVPDADGHRWLGLAGQIEGIPSLSLCRSQIEIRCRGANEGMVRRLAGPHAVLVYGDLLRETGYALRRVPIGWECLG